MTIGTIGFVKERLTQAREARGLSLVALADLVGVSAVAISHYEKGEHTPRPETLVKLSDKLSLPMSFFLKPDAVSKESAKIFWRSMSAATKQARARAERRYEWFVEITEYLREFFEFPESRVPEFDLPDDFRKIDTMLVEVFAEQLRREWRLSFGPIPDVVRTLEANGVLVSLGSMGTEYLDAFSEFDETNQAYICLGIDKEIMVRRRYDAAHELGHLILHRKVDRKTLNRAADFKLIESQANQFANAFLLPGKSFVEELFTPSLDGFRALKSRWKVSIAAMIHRSYSLNLVTEDQAKRLWINLNRRDWRRFEPLDDLPPERPSTVAKCFSTLIEEGIKSKEQIIADLRLAPQDVEELTALPRGFFSGHMAEADTGPQLRRHKSGNIVAFRR